MFKNFGTGTKLFILCGMFIIPIAVTIYDFVAERRLDIVFARRELAGSRYIASLRETYASILRSQLSGDSTVHPPASADEVLQRLAAAEAESAGSLKTAELERTLEAALRRYWSEPVTGRNLLAPEILKNARALVSRVGDDSNLALDMDSDSHYLQEIVVARLPVYVSQLCEMQALVRADTAGAAFAGSHAGRLLILDGLLRSSIEDVRDGLAAAYRGNADGSLKRAVDSDMAAMIASGGSYLSAVSAGVIGQDLVGIDATSLDRAYASAVDSAMNAWTSGQAEFDRLVRRRIADLNGRLQRSLALIGALAGLSILVAMMTYRHIVRPLERLEGLARTVRDTKNYSLRVDSDSQDEIGRLAVEFNDMLSELAAARGREVADHARSAEQALELIVTVTGVASAAATLAALASACVERICVSREWQLGQAWFPDRQEGVLRCSADVLFGGPKFHDFHALSVNTPLREGQGLPGQAWQQKAAVWISHSVANDNNNNFPRLQASRKLGIRAAFAFPVVFQDEVLAIFEFLTEQARPPDGPFLDAVGKLGRLLGDIVERKRSEAALRLSGERWRLVFENSLFGMGLHGQDLRYIATNSAFQSMVGYSEEELRQLTPRDLSFEEEWESNAALFAELKEGKRQYYDLVKRLKRKDGAVIWVRVYVFMVPAESESMPAMTFSTTIDVTDSKLAQDALRATQFELARVTRLSAMGQMAASIAHEINQPLAAIVSGGSAALRWLSNPTPDPDEARAALKRIVSDGHRASQVISGIRAMFKNVDREKAPLDVNQVIREVLALLHAELENQRIVVQTDLSRELAPVQADRIQLQQVLANLVTNAIEAMHSVEDRPRLLRVKSAPREPDGVLITVEDSGHGIDPKNIDRIFHPFFTTKSQGMGMGLAICRSIIEAHDGRLSAQAATGQGSVFEIALPAGHLGSAG